MATLSSHVLDTSRGRPASEVPVELRSAAGEVLGASATDADGRVAGLGGDLAPGDYRLRFDTAAHFGATGAAGFYPEVVVVFRVASAEQHYHVPVLLSPFAYSTYRGS